MSTNGFDAEDLSSTLARFSDKRRNIVYDEAKLKRKAPEPLELSSATNACGAIALSAVANLLAPSSEGKIQNDKWRKHKQKQREDWENQDRQWYENR